MTRSSSYSLSFLGPDAQSPEVLRLSGLLREFTLMSRDLFRRSPGEGPDLRGQSVGAVRKARTERRALGRLADGGGHSHRRFSEKPRVIEERMLPCSIAGRQEELSGTRFVSERSDLTAAAKQKDSRHEKSLRSRKQRSARPRGAIRTHLGRKRTGARSRRSGFDTRPGELDR